MEDLTKGLKESREQLAKGRHQEALARLMHLTEKYPEDREVKSAIAAALNLRGIAQAEAAQGEKLASVGLLAAGIAHEINTLIQYVGDNIRFL